MVVVHVEVVHALVQHRLAHAGCWLRVRYIEVVPQRWAPTIRKPGSIRARGGPAGGHRDEVDGPPGRGRLWTGIRRPRGGSSAGISHLPGRPAARRPVPAGPPGSAPRGRPGSRRRQPCLGGLDAERRQQHGRCSTHWPRPPAPARAADHRGLQPVMEGVEADRTLGEALPVPDQQPAGVLAMFQRSSRRARRRSRPRRGRGQAAERVGRAARSAPAGTGQPGVSRPGTRCR